MSKTQPHPFLYVTLIAALLAAYFLLQPYLSTAILAFITVTLFQGYYHRLKKLIKHATLTTITAVISVMLLFLIPLILFANMVIRQIFQFSSDISAFASANGVNLADAVDAINLWIEKVPYTSTITLSEVTNFIEQTTRSIANFALDNAIGIGNSSLEVFTQFFVFGVFLYLFFPLLPRLKHLLINLSPLDNHLDELYYHRIVTLMQSLVKGTLVVAIIQSSVAAIFLFIAGVPYVPFWMLLMLMTGIIPVIGTGFVSVPIGVVLLAMGRIWHGLFVILGSLLVVANLDNIIRPILVSKEARLRPALVLLGIIGGLKLFGFLGFLYGPVVMVFLTTTLEIYLKHPN